MNHRADQWEDGVNIKGGIFALAGFCAIDDRAAPGWPWQAQALNNLLANAVGARVLVTAPC